MEVATMSFVTERNEIAFLTADDKYGLIKFMNRKAYRVSDTSLTYRQINYLDKDGLLGDDTRQGGKGWRIFSLKEVVYLLMVVELKKYGFTQDWLRPICHTLLVAGKKETPNKHMFDELIGLCLGGLEINAVAYNDGPLLFYDPTFYALNREGDLLKKPVEKLDEIKRFLTD